MIAIRMEKPVVRVIWGGGFGSSYQGFYPWSCPKADPIKGEKKRLGGYSRFSRPLSCPSCKETLELQQRDPNKPDQLLGLCSCCPAWFLLDIGPDGRISPTTLRSRRKVYLALDDSAENRRTLERSAKFDHQLL